MSLQSQARGRDVAFTAVIALLAAFLTLAFVAAGSTIARLTFEGHQDPSEGSPGGR